MTFFPEALIAAMPIVVILILMVAARWPAAKAGGAGLGTALLLAGTRFADQPGAYRQLGFVGATAGSLAEALFTAGTILWIIFPALCIHRLQLRTGAINLLKESMARLSADPRLAAILIAWFFALFIEGAAGFGTPVALAAPILVSLGFRPAEAVTLALIGHSAGVSFGAVGTPILPQIAATGFNGRELAQATGIYHSLLGGVLLLIAVGFAGRALKEGVRTAEPIWGWTLLAAALFLLPYFAISRWVGPELPTLGGALLGGFGFIAALRWFRRKEISTEAAGGKSAARRGDLLRAGAPYLVLVALILATRLIPPVRERLAEPAWEWSLLGLFEGRMAPLYHPGTILFLGFFLGALWQRASRQELKEATGGALRQLGSVAIALAAMLGLARVMVHSGMIAALAEAAAEGAGAFWPLFAPFVGVLGTFITGSATASNILFTDFQQATAQTLLLPPLQMAAAQGFGAAVGNIVSPHNIIAGSATVGSVGAEGEILKRTLWVCGLYALLGGLLALFLSW